MDDKNTPAGKDEELRIENDVMKMKLMLQHNAQFDGDDIELPAEIENAFLKNVMEFENQFHQGKQIKIYDKIGRPAHFHPANEIPEDQIAKAWKKLLKLLQKNGIDLNVISPNISTRELYRFTTEELFEHETDDINIPGMMCCFIYDEFHPDPVYESENLVKHLLKAIFSIEPMDEYFFGFKHKDLLLEENIYPTDEEVKKRINSFKSEFETLELEEYQISVAAEESKTSRTSQGTYRAAYTLKNGIKKTLTGCFTITCAGDENKYWFIERISFTPVLF